MKRDNVKRCIQKRCEMRNSSKKDISTLLTTYHINENMYIWKEKRERDVLEKGPIQE